MANVPAASTASTTAASGNWWERLDPDTRKALILAGANLGQGYFASRAEDARYEDERRDSAIRTEAEGQQALLNAEANDYQFNANRNDSNAAQAARMAGTSPLQFQSQRMQMSALNDILSGSGRHSFAGMPTHIGKHMPTGVNMTPFSAQTHAFATPGAMAASEQPYWAAQQNVDPRLKSPNLSAMGYGSAGQGITDALETERTGRLDTRQREDDEYKATSDARKAALEASLAELGPEAEAQRAAAEDKGIDWKKWGTLAAGAAGSYYLGGLG